VRLSQASLLMLALVLALLAALGAGAASTPPPEPVAAEIRMPERFVSADFVQQRRIAALDRPLVSRGSVSVSEDGFVWRQQAPYPVSLSFDGTAIVETSTLDGHATTRTVRDPITNNLTRTLFQMMTGSWQQMQGSFAIHALTPPDEADWALAMKPHDEAVSEVIPRIVLTGNRFVDTILVEDNHGNTTRIELSNQRLQQ
jgi:hypothetical protein